MKTAIMSAAAIIAASLAVGCRTTGSDDLRAFSGVAINEVAAHDERDDGTTWVELYNTSGNDVDLSGLKLFLYDAYFDGFVLHEFEGSVLAPGERMLLSTEDGGLKTGIASDSEFEIRLAKDRSGDFVDSFSNSGLSPQKQLPVAGQGAVLSDVEMITNGSETPCLMVAEQLFHGIILVASGGRAVDDDEADTVRSIHHQSVFHPGQQVALVEHLIPTDNHGKRFLYHTFLLLEIRNTRGYA